MSYSTLYFDGVIAIDGGDSDGRPCLLSRQKRSLIVALRWSADRGESFIHKITHYEVSSGRTLLRFDPKVEPEDMNKAPHLWNFTVQDAVMEEYPVESSFGEHVMCYKDEDCQDVRETMQNIEGVASVGMCCEYCTTLLAGKMCKGEWEQVRLSAPMSDVLACRMAVKLTANCGGGGCGGCGSGP